MKKRLSRLKIILSVTLLGMVCCPSFLLAQDLPCDGNDPYSTCPLDGWVWLLGSIAVIFAVIHLYRKKKPAAVSFYNV